MSNPTIPAWIHIREIANEMLKGRQRRLGAHEDSRAS